jgi:hypothetical protein
MILRKYSSCVTAEVLLILGRCTSCGRVASFTPWPLYPPLNRRLFFAKSGEVNSILTGIRCRELEDCAEILCCIYSIISRLVFRLLDVIRYKAGLQLIMHRLHDMHELNPYRAVPVCLSPCTSSRTVGQNFMTIPDWRILRGRGLSIKFNFYLYRTFLIMLHIKVVEKNEARILFSVYFAVNLRWYEFIFKLSYSTQASRTQSPLRKQ